MAYMTIGCADVYVALLYVNERHAELLIYMNVNTVNPTTV